MKKELNLTFFYDPGHGWLEVDEKTVKEVGFRPSKYSYYNPKTKKLYLEEDCDAPQFVNEIEKIGWTMKVTENAMGAFVRNFSRTA